jgi:uncharacterized repeat protein (TIGR03803 family)
MKKYLSALASSILSACRLRGATRDKAPPIAGASILHSFSATSGSSFPSHGLVQGRDGAAYGSTVQGGANVTGSIFTIAPDGVETELYAFPAADGGAYPSNLVQGRDDHFYGTTSAGGAYHKGTIFRISPAGIYTLLYSFGAASDGTHPKAGLLLGPDDNLYGTTCAGGDSNNGTIFRATPGGMVTVLYSFGPPPDGANPLAGLILASDGHLYGTTASGGIHNSGTVFRL